MKNISKIINERLSGKEDASYKNVPVKEYYKACVNGYKQWAIQYGHKNEGYEKMDDSKVTEYALTLMCPSFDYKKDKIKPKFIEGQGWDNSDVINALKEFFENNWDNNFENGKRILQKDTWNRYYHHEFSVGDDVISDHYQMGPMTELNKYKEK